MADANEENSEYAELEGYAWERISRVFSFLRDPGKVELLGPEAFTSWDEVPAWLQNEISEIEDAEDLPELDWRGADPDPEFPAPPGWVAP